MQGTGWPQQLQPVHHPFDPAARQQAIRDIIQPILQVHESTITPSTPTRSFPDDNIVGTHNADGQLVLHTTPRTGFAQDCVDKEIFIGSNPVGVSNDTGMAFYMSCYGRVGGVVQIPRTTLHFVAAPRTPESAVLSLRYIDGATILHLLRRSVHSGRVLRILPFRYDGSFASENPELALGDLILQVAYADTGAAIGALDWRIIPNPPVSVTFWP